ncbi:sulfatase [Halosquirtibacter xylanolyticus]|uniref:sulfatase family protein n=1 Tax=Halosquirtibacter xylanolyticus TaxID=3374599 RepID=UPI003747BB60|nr:sulfatase [Prolixibacteraceae bacterium]
MDKKSLLFISSVLLGSFFTVNAKKKERKPNILFIMSDDHTSQAIGIYGGRLASLNPTPNIDRIGEEGIVFENAFCTNSICSPSRASIMTGQYSQTNGVLDLVGRLSPENQYLPQEMKRNGYQTAIVGKWHLRDKPEAFDYYNVFHGQGRYFDPVLYEKGSDEKVSKRDCGLIWMRVDSLPGHKYYGHSSDIVTDLSLDWLENKRDKSRPFILMHHFKAPHDLFEFNPKYKDYLAEKFIPEPASMYYDSNHGSIATKGEVGKLLDTIGSSVGKRNIIRNMGMHMEIDSTLSDQEYKHQAYQEYLKRYLRCVKGVDDNVKRLLDYLEVNDLLDNTIIIYTGDQGFNLGEHDYIDKRWMYEESMRMPFLVRYPKIITPNTRTDAIINNTDFAPTIIDIAGGEIPEEMQGHSFKEILESGKEPQNWQQETYYRYWMHMAHNHGNPAHLGIRTKRYKLILFYGKDYTVRGGMNPNKYQLMTRLQTPVAWELYDLQEDPMEMNNCYDDPKYQEVVVQLKDRLRNKRKELNEEDAKYPELERIIENNWN